MSVTASPPPLVAARVVALVWSEFGRRPRDNESGGTDLGPMGLMMVVGDRASGGIRSEVSGPGRLDDDDDNLFVTTQFRTVYASLLERCWAWGLGGCCRDRPVPDRPGG